MITKRIFIASSAELKRERNELVDVIQDLNDEVEGRGTKFKPVLWEYMDSSMGEKRKEDEYLEKLRKCEICIVLFWRSLGEYTVEELNVAVEEMKADRLPKQVYVLFKEPCDGLSKELNKFKESFSMKYSHIHTLKFSDEKLLRTNITNILLPKELAYGKFEI
jgi:hypothetical protein